MVFSTQPASAQERLRWPYSFSIAPQFGFFHGQAEEIVYPPSYAYKGTELYSQLLWDMKPVFYYGLLLDLSRTRPMERWGFFVTASFKSGAPGKSGIMEDRDWLSAENNALTCYSKHDNYTKWIGVLDVSAGLSFPLRRTLLLKPFINLSYMYFSFYGKDGWGIYARHLGSSQYASINDDPTKIPFKGKVINYTQQWLIGAPGIALDYHFLECFTAALSFQISPLILCVDVDQHLTTKTEYNDYMQWGLFLEPGFSFTFAPLKWLELAVECSWRYIAGARGETYQRPIGAKEYVQAGKAGTGLSLVDTGLSLKIRF